MKTKEIFGIALSCLCATTLMFSCTKEKKIDPVDESIEVTPTKIESGYEGEIYDITVTANCDWNVVKTDQQDNVITWIKSDCIKGSGSKSFKLRVYKNPDSTARAGVVKIYGLSSTAFIDVTQAKNPDVKPDDPVPPGPIEPTGAYTMPVYQMFQTAGGIECPTCGTVKSYDFSEYCFSNATVDGNRVVFSEGLVIEKVGTDGAFQMSWPVHTNPKLHAGFQLGLCASYAPGEDWIYKIPMKETLSGDLRFAYGSRKEGTMDASKYKWSSDEGATWNDVTSMAALASDAAFKAVYFTIPAEKAVPAGKQLWIKESAQPTAGVVYLQSGFTLDWAQAPKSTVPAQDAAKIVISEGFDDIVGANAAMLEVPGFMGSATTGYTANATTDTKAYTPANAALETVHCFARPGFLQIGYSDEALLTRCGWNGILTLKVGDRLKEMGIGSASLSISFKVAGRTNAFVQKCDASVVVKNGESIVGKVTDLQYDKWGSFSCSFDADQTTVITITSEDSTKPDKGTSTGTSPFETADYRFFVDDIVVSVGGPVGPVVPPSGPVTLDFDFTQTLEGWPTAKNTPWTGAKGLDSGHAAENGGTATDNPHRRALFTYPLDGKEYDFMFVSPDNLNTDKNIYLSLGKGIYSGTYRSLGLPVIEGMRLTKLVMVQNASTKDPASFNRGVGICKNIIPADGTTVDISKYEYVAGGELQNQFTNLGEYTYNLSGTEAGVMYYLNSPQNASIIKSLVLTYEP